MNRGPGKRRQPIFSRRVNLGISWFARRKALVALCLVVFSVGGRVALLSRIPIPKPAIQDEFGYLLASDTFASGRLTNPQHPMWMHFETVHEIVRPTYQAKYGPLQGMVLALGQVLFAQPWAGVLLSMGLLNAALWWALSGWLPPRWALLGSVLALLRVGFLNYWSESYWGGAVTAIGGALVIGSVPRLRNLAMSPRLTAVQARKPALVMAVGLAILANTRPYEGLVLGLSCLAAVLVKAQWRSLIGPLALVLVPVGAWMGYYNYRVTGNPLLLPYRAHERQYVTWSPFIWDTHPRPAPHYNHEDLRATWIDWEQKNWTYERAHPLKVRLPNLLTLTYFFPGFLLALCAAAFLWPMVRRQPKMRVALALSLLMLLGLELETMLWPHYVAPATALVFIVATAAMRRLRYQSRVAFLLTLAAVVFFDVGQMTTPANRWLFDKRNFIAERETVLRQLGQSTGEQLVLVQYGPKHDVNDEWVYNKADIDKARIVWAHAMSPEKDEELVHYYRDRQVWRLIDNGMGNVALQPDGSRQSHSSLGRVPGLARP